MGDDATIPGPTKKSTRNLLSFTDPSDNLTVPRVHDNNLTEGPPCRYRFTGTKVLLGTKIRIQI